MYTVFLQEIFSISARGHFLHILWIYVPYIRFCIFFVLNMLHVYSIFVMHFRLNSCKMPLSFIKDLECTNIACISFHQKKHISRYELLGLIPYFMKAFQIYVSIKFKFLIIEFYVHSKRRICRNNALHCWKFVLSFRKQSQSFVSIFPD